MSGSLWETIRISVFSAPRESPSGFPGTFGRSDHGVGNAGSLVPSLEKGPLAFRLDRLRTGMINLL